MSTWLQAVLPRIERGWARRLATVIERARRRQRRRRLLLVTAGALAASAAAVAFFALRATAPAPHPGSPALVVRQFALRAAPVAITTADRSLWVIVEGRQMQVLLWKLDSNSGKRLASYTIGKTGPDLGAVTSSGHIVFAAAGEQILRLDLTGPRRIRRTHLPGEANGVAVGFSSVWVTTIGERDYLIRLNADTLAPEARIRLDDQPVAVKSGLGAVWLALFSSVQRLNPANNRLVTTYGQAEDVVGLTLTRSHVWVLERTETITTLNRHGDPVGLTRLPFTPSAIAVSGKRIWVTNNCGCATGKVALIDSRTHQIHLISVGKTPVGVAATGSTAWVATFEDAKLWRVSIKP